MVYRSLYKDFFYEDSGSTQLSYYLTCDNETIYAGKATNPKGIKINIRKLVEDWVQNDMPDFRPFDGELVLHEDACKVFRLYDEESNLLEEYMVFLSYESLAVPMFTYRGINGHADPRQKIFFGMLTEEEVEVEIDEDDGEGGGGGMVTGTPQPNEIWINKEAYAGGGGLWFKCRDRINDYESRVVDSDHVQHPLNDLGYQIIEEEDKKIIRFPYTVSAFRNLAFNEYVEDLYWIIFPPSFSNTDINQTGANWRLIPCKTSGPSAGVNNDLKAVRFTYSKEWQDYYSVNWGSNRSVFVVNADDFNSALNLETIDLPRGLSSAMTKYDSFDSVVALKSLYIPNGFVYLEGRSFAYCNSLTSVSLPRTIGGIGMDYYNRPNGTPHIVFQNCGLLTEIVYRGTVAQFKQITNYNYLANPGVVVRCTDGDYTIV